MRKKCKRNKIKAESMLDDNNQNIKIKKKTTKAK